MKLTYWYAVCLDNRARTIRALDRGTVAQIRGMEVDGVGIPFGPIRRKTVTFEDPLDLLELVLDGGIEEVGINHAAVSAAQALIGSGRGGET